jgi:hypothetical protein
MLWLAEFQSLMAVHYHFRMHYGHQPPTRRSIRFWENKLRTTGSLLSVKSPGKTWTSEENVNRIREAVQRSPCKSVCAAGLQLYINNMLKQHQLLNNICVSAIGNIKSNEGYKIKMIAFEIQ